jgi:hypothetical protein
MNKEGANLVLRFTSLRARGKVRVMNTWLTVRAFLALYVLICGIGLMFGQSDGGRVVIGALFVSVGLTFLLRLWVTLRQQGEQSDAKS